jgi:hypothetical protein
MRDRNTERKERTMTVRFYVDGFRNMMAEMDGEHEVMIVTKFNSNENKTKAANYLKTVAPEITRLYNAGDIDAAEALLNEAEAKVRSAQVAEKFLEEVTF